MPEDLGNPRQDRTRRDQPERERDIARGRQPARDQRPDTEHAEGRDVPPNRPAIGSRDENDPWLGGG